MRFWEILKSFCERTSAAKVVFLLNVELNAVKCSVCSIAHAPESADMSPSRMDLKHSSVSIAFHTSLDELFNCDGHWWLSLNIHECECVCVCACVLREHKAGVSRTPEEMNKTAERNPILHYNTVWRTRSIQHTHSSALLITMSFI